MIALYLALPGRLIIGPRWLVPALELAIFVPLAITARFATAAETLARRLALLLLGLVNIVNALSAGLLARRLIVTNAASLSGHQLVDASLSIWLTNVIVFALWFWELDRGGPLRRGTADEQMPDFLFPQMSTPQFAPRDWQPAFFDYLYTALTNAAAFSPTDTMPLSRWAKALMSLESLIALVTVVVVAARAVNIL